jgi:cytochrome P450
MMAHAPSAGLVATLMHEDTTRDPYPLYDDLRADTPVRWDGDLRTWVLTRYADVNGVLQDSGAFASDWRRGGEDLPLPVRSIQTLDLDEHSTVRRLFADGFRHADHRQLERRIGERVSGRCAELASRGSFDFVTELAEPVALATIAEFLGVELPAEEWFLPVSHTIVDGMDAGLWPETGPPALEARAELAAMAERWLAHPPGQGLLSYLAERLAGSGVDHTVACNSVRVLLHAGFESASRLLGIALAALLAEPEGPGLAAFACADPALAVAELVRFSSPVQADARFCVQDRVIGGVVIRCGDEVTAMLGAANRDPEQFSEPHRLRLDRDPNRHLGFGRGTHACLGSALATLQARVVFTTLASHYPGARLVAAPVYRRNVTLRGLSRLEMSLT